MSYSSKPSQESSESPGSDPMRSASVARTLLSMSAPISLGMLATFLFQVVDTFFVGQLGPSELAALGFAATAYFLAVALFMGMAVGVSSLVGNALGQGDEHLARRYATVSSLLAAAVAIALCGIGLATLRPLFRLLGAGPELIPLIAEYMSILYYGLPLLVVGLVGSAAIRATGRVKAPEIVMGIAGCINLVLDYVLIFGVGPFPRMELAGAALATVASWVFVCACIVALLFRRQLVTLARGNLAREVKEIVRLSAPAIATQVLLPITAMLITYLAARSGAQAVAAFGVATRIETLVLVGISSVSVAVVPFVAQSHGANERERVDRAIAFVGKASFYWGGGLFVLLLVFAGPIAELFSSDPQIIYYTKLYFYFVAVSYAPYGIVVMTSAIFNGVMIPGKSLQVLLIKTFAFTVPLALAGSFFGAVGVFAAISLSNILGFVYAARLMKRCLAQSGSTLADKRVLDDYLADWRAIADRLGKRARRSG